MTRQLYVELHFDAVAQMTVGTARWSCISASDASACKGFLQAVRCSAVTAARLVPFGDDASAVPIPLICVPREVRSIGWRTAATAAPGRTLGELISRPSMEYERVACFAREPVLPSAPDRSSWSLEWTFSSSWGQTRGHSAFHASACSAATRQQHPPASDGEAVVCELFASCYDPSVLPQLVPLPVGCGTGESQSSAASLDDAEVIPFTDSDLATATLSVTVAGAIILGPMTLVGGRGVLLRQFAFVVWGSNSGFGAVLPPVCTAEVTHPSRDKDTNTPCRSLSVTVVGMAATAEGATQEIADRGAAFIRCITQQASQSSVSLALESVCIIVAELSCFAFAWAREGVLHNACGGCVVIDASLALALCSHPPFDAFRPTSDDEGVAAETDDGGGSAARLHPAVVFGGAVAEAALMRPATKGRGTADADEATFTGVARGVALALILSGAGGSDRVVVGDTLDDWVEYAAARAEWCRSLHSMARTLPSSGSSFRHPFHAQAVAHELLSLAARLAIPASWHGVGESAPMFLSQCGELLQILLRTTAAWQGKEREQQRRDTSPQVAQRSTVSTLLPAVAEACRSASGDDSLLRGNVSGAVLAASPFPFLEVGHRLSVTWSPGLGAPIAATIRITIGNNALCQTPVSSDGLVPVRLYFWAAVMFGADGVPTATVSTPSTRVDDVHRHEAERMLVDTPVDGGGLVILSTADFAVPLAPQPGAQRGAASPPPPHHHRENDTAAAAPDTPASSTVLFLPWSVHRGMQTIVVAVPDPLGTLPNVSFLDHDVADARQRRQAQQGRGGDLPAWHYQSGARRWCDGERDTENMLFSAFPPSGVPLLGVQGSLLLLRHHVASERPLLMLRVCRTSPWAIVRIAALRNLRVFFDRALARRRTDRAWDEALTTVVERTLRVTRALQRCSAGFAPQCDLVGMSLAGGGFPLSSWPRTFRGALGALVSHARLVRRALKNGSSKEQQQEGGGTARRSYFNRLACTLGRAANAARESTSSTEAEVGWILETCGAVFSPREGTDTEAVDAGERAVRHLLFQLRPLLPALGPVRRLLELLDDGAIALW